MAPGNYDLIHFVAALLATLLVSWAALIVLAWIPGIPSLRRAINGRKLRIWLAHGVSLATVSILTHDIALKDGIFINVLAEAIWLWGDFRRLRRTSDAPEDRRIDLSRGLRPGTGIPFFALLVVVFGYGIGGEALRWNAAELFWPDRPAPWETIDGFVLPVDAEPADIRTRAGLPDLSACAAWPAEAGATLPGARVFCAVGPDRYGRWEPEPGLPTAYRLLLAQ